MKYINNGDNVPQNSERVEVKLDKSGLDFKMSNSPYIRFAIGTSLIILALSAFIIAAAPNGLMQ